MSETIDVKRFCADFEAEPYYSDPSELLYRTDTAQFVYVFKYGAVCFLNYDAAHMAAFLKLIHPYCKNVFEQSFTDEFLVDTGARELRVGFNKIDIPSADTEVLRLVMLNVSQSVALDYYEHQTDQLLTEANYYTQMLENKGRMVITGKKLKRYIARTLLLRNRIAESIYVFDSPPEAWENEQLNRIDTDLKRTFDLQVRVRSLHEGLSIIRDNLDLFNGMMQHRYSNLLEWIVIILILVEVLNLAIERLF